MIYPIIALIWIASVTFGFYKGYEYADNKAELEQARAQIEQLKTSELYYKNAHIAARTEAGEALKSLEANQETVDKLNVLVASITENPICVDNNILKLLREIK